MDNQKVKSTKQGTLYIKCPKCKEKLLIQANLEKNTPLRKDYIPYPVDNDGLKCPNCGAESNISNIRLKIEAQAGKKILK